MSTDLFAEGLSEGQLRDIAFHPDREAARFGVAIRDR
jgi:hypothetical protein